MAKTTRVLPHRRRSIWTWLSHCFFQRNSIKTASQSKVRRSVNAVEKQSGPPPHLYFRRGRRWSYFWLSMYITVGAIALLLLISGIAWAIIHIINLQTLIIVLTISLAGGLFIFSARSAHNIRLSLHPNVAELVGLDSRAPVVLLRSFTDDTLTFESTEADEKLRDFVKKYPELTTIISDFVSAASTFINRDFSISIDESGALRQRGEFEKILYRKLRRIGPLVAIGDPQASQQKKIGASRAYFDDQEWRDNILAWMEKARIIVIIAGQSEGVVWEMEQVAARGYLRKLLIVMPPHAKRLPLSDFFFRTLSMFRLYDESARRKRWKVIGDNLVKEEFRSSFRRPGPGDAICVFFGPDGAPVVVESPTHGKRDYHEAIEIALYGIFAHDWSHEGGEAANHRKADAANELVDADGGGEEKNKLNQNPPSATGSQ